MIALPKTKQIAPENRLYQKETIHFQVLYILVSGRVDPKMKKVGGYWGKFMVIPRPAKAPPAHAASSAW